MIILFPPFEPDKSPFYDQASSHAINALPRANGWGPMPSLSVISDALPGEERGSVYVRDANGAYTIIAGTETGLYKLNTSDYSWDDVSGSSAPYAVPTGDRWTFTVFGSKLIAHQIGDPIQVYDIESGGTFADLGGSPPKAKYSCVSGDFLVLGNLDGDNGEKSVLWSGVNDIEAWTLQEKGADYQELPDGVEVMACFGEQGGFYVICRSAMHYFQFSPSSGFTFVRTTINPKQGTIAPLSVVSVGPQQFYYFSEDGFFSGTDRKPIGAERVDTWFLSQIDTGYYADVQGVADPFEKIVWWSYRTTSGMSRRLGYDWQLDRWCASDQDIGSIIPLVTPGVTWEGLDDLYGSIGEITESFDSRLFIGGRPTLATFTSDNKLAYFSGPELPVTLKTAQVQPSKTNRTMCQGGRVITDALDFTLTDTVYAYHGADGTVSAPATINRAGNVPLRSDGSLHLFTLNIAAGAEWTIASGFDATFVNTGAL